MLSLGARSRPSSAGSARQIVLREADVLIQAGRIGRRVLADDLLDGMTEQQLLDRQLLLLAGQRVRNLRHGKTSRRPGTDDLAELDEIS
jgi:hypothetical protein